MSYAPLESRKYSCLFWFDKENCFLISTSALDDVGRNQQREVKKDHRMNSGHSLAKGS